MSFLLKLDNIDFLYKYSWLQNKYLQFGLSLGGTRFGLNTENLIFSNMIDAYEYNIQSSQIYLTIL